MSHWHIQPGGSLQGTLIPPPDKSITHRALIFGSLAKGESRIFGGLASEDCLATAKIFAALGVHIEGLGSDTWRIQSPGLHGFSAPPGDLDCGNSGTTCRLMAGILAAQKFSSRLIGDDSLSRRPMKRIIEPLQQMLAQLQSTGGFLPLTILPCGPSGLKGITYANHLNSAQVKSALLLAGLYAHGTTLITEAIPSRDHTERFLASQGILEAPDDPYQKGVKGPVPQLRPIDLTIPGDFSSAGFWLVAGGLLPGTKLKLTGVGLNPTRTGLMDALRDMGWKIQIQADRSTKNSAGEPLGDLTIQDLAVLSENKSVLLAGAQVVQSIDEIPLWLMAASFQAKRLRQGEFVLRDASELRVKESDRLAGMCENLRRLGVTMHENEDGVVIPAQAGQGPPGFLHPETSGYGPGYLESFGDHRLAMTLAIAALTLESTAKIVEIRDTDCVATSYPNFLQDLDRLREIP